MPSAIPLVPIGANELGGYLAAAADYADERRLPYMLGRAQTGDWIATFQLSDGHGPFAVEVTVRQPLKDWRDVMNAAIVRVRSQRVKNFGRSAE